MKTEIKIVPVNRATQYMLALLQRIASALPRAQVLSLCGDVLATLLPYLEKRHFVELAGKVAGIDPDRLGPDDEAAAMLYELGGTTIEVIISEGPVEVPTP